MPNCLDFLLLSHDGLGHALSEVKHEVPALTLLTRLVRSARLRCTNLARLATDRAPSVSRYQEPVAPRLLGVHWTPCFSTCFHADFWRSVLF